MNVRTIRALLKKDLALFRSDRLYLVLTVLSLVFFTAIYFVMPRQVDEDFSLGMYAPVLPPAFSQLTQQPGTDIEFFQTEDDMKQSILDGKYQAGIALPANIMEIWDSGGKPDITIYYASTAPPEVAEAVKTLVEELSFNQAGQALSFNVDEEVLGPDMLGEQVALRDRMRPLWAVLILLLETMTLASLITVEIEQGTARALLVTPMSTSDLFTAKAVLGVSMAFFQAVLFMAIVGGFNLQPLIILAALMLGSFFVMGAGFLLASLARNVQAVTGWGVLVLIVLVIPGFGAVIPGLISDWARVIPSYYLVDTVNRAANYGAGWGEVWPNMAILAGITVALIWAGLLVLRRRYQ
jgi:ABC-2 type transport system permease protein